jgi:hypothetical protein
MLGFTKKQEKVVDFYDFEDEYIDIMEKSGLQWSTMEYRAGMRGAAVGAKPL